MEIERRSLEDQYYLFVDREVSFSEPGAIANAMATGFGEVFTFVENKKITPLSMPASIYLAMPAGPTMAFRAAVFVSKEDSAHADENIQAGFISGGHAVTGTHIGSYANLNQSHKALWDFADENGFTKEMPVWEIYVDDPSVIAEDNLRTDIFRKVAG